MSLSPDRSNGYEELAEIFMRIRDEGVGPEVVWAWCQSLAPGSSVLDLGCGSGIPITRILVEQGFAVYGVDASRKMIQAFRKNFPGAQAECAAVEESNLFERSFDGIVACGLLFLLTADCQEIALRKAARAVKPGGRFLFTSPRESLAWKDAITNLPSISLGATAYEQILTAEGMDLVGNEFDFGGNYYYFFQKPG